MKATSSLRRIYLAARLLLVLLAVLGAALLIAGAAAAGLGAVKRASDAVPGVFTSTKGAVR